MARQTYMLVALFVGLFIWASRSHLQMECNEQNLKLMLQLYVFDQTIFT